MHLRKLAAFSSLVLTFAAARAQNPCEALKDLKFDHSQVTAAKWSEAGPVNVPMGFPPKDQAIPAVRHCEVSLVSRPTTDSEIGILLWLPAPEDWNGKYLQKGNGGWAGQISLASLIQPASRGYAVSATDDGHKAASPIPDATWALGHPEKLRDFGYRSLHETAQLSKTVISAYYRKPQSHAYFAGCSDGGREALMEAERFPEDFDGVIAGAPANYWTHHFAGFIWNELALEQTPDSKIPITNLPGIEKAVLAQCDAADGVKDGLIEDPRQCRFDPSVLLCHATAGPDCLTQPQIDALKKIYSGPKDPVTGEQIYPGYEPGVEGEPGGWGLWIIAPPGFPASGQALFGNTFFGQALYENPSWDHKTFDLHRDTLLADEKAAPLLNSYNPDLRAFRAHGGKLISYHGWGDAAISPLNSIEFYNKVAKFLATYPDPRTTGDKDIHAFYRLFMVPGMGHCAGGPGPTSFGNDDTESDATIPVDPDHDLLSALDRWVTSGVAPDKLIGTGKIAVDPKSNPNGTRITRPLCAYPKVAHYKGQGDSNSADSFECIASPTN